MRNAVLGLSLFFLLTSCGLTKRDTSGAGTTPQAQASSPTTPVVISTADCLASLGVQICPLYCVVGGEICTVANPNAGVSGQTAQITGSGCNSCLATQVINSKACELAIPAAQITAFQSQITCSNGP